VLVPYGESKAFIDSAAKLSRELQALHKIRRQAREYVAAISWQRVVERFEALLTSALSQSHTAPNSSLTRQGLAT
jgi:hypothetical protein